MKRLFLLIIALLTTFVFVPTTYALNNFKADKDLDIKENFNDNAFIAGETIKMDSYIDGLGFMAGKTLDIKGEADYAFIAGETINLDSFVAKDIYVAGKEIKLSHFNLRNIYLAGETVTVNGDAKDLYIGGDTVTLTGNYDNVFVGCTKLKINGTISGTLEVNEDAEIEYAEGATIGEVKKTAAIKMSKDNVWRLVIISIIAKVMSIIMHFINMLILGFVLIAIYKKANKKIADTKANGSAVLGRFAIGLCVLIATPIASIILLCTGIASALGFVTLILYGLALYLASMISSIYISRHLLKNMNEYLAYFLVLLVVTLLSNIPVIGWIFKFVLLCIGLGVIIAITRQEKVVEEVPVVEAPAKAKKTTKTTKKGK